MLAVLIQVLDTTIANVALPHMQASLGATQESINWVLTSYIVASAIAIPISGWLADRIGRKRLLILAVIGFTFASLLCATATSLTEMVIFRALQGVTGAFLVRLSQATLFDINPPERHARAMALFGGGIMIGPIMGPLLGGWLTDSFDWRWVFLVNLAGRGTGGGDAVGEHAEHPDDHAQVRHFRLRFARAGARQPAIDARPRRSSSTGSTAPKSGSNAGLRSAPGGCS